MSRDLSAFLLSAASDLSRADEPSFSPDTEGFDIIQSARTLTDFVLNFVPIASLAKDLVCLAISINPITNEEVESVDYGLITAGILVPGVRRGSAIGVTKCIQFVNLALHNPYTATATATRLLPPLQAADHFLLSLAKDATKLAEFAPEATQRLSQAINLLPFETPLEQLVSVESYHSNAELVPLGIAQRLVGRVCKSFDQFRKEFGLATSESKYAAQWGPLNVEPSRYEEMVGTDSERGRGL